MGLNRWRQIGQRMRQMDGAELRDRLRQEFGKRQDAFLGWTGYDFARKIGTAGEPGNFFFSSEAIEPIVALMRQRLPGQAERIVQQADRICSHRFDLLGYFDIDYGRPIDWHLDAVHGKRAPRKAFYKIRYLDYEEVGDSKITWELNRHQHLVTLAKAYRLTGDRRFADEALRQWRHWQDENPYPVGINWVSSLEVAFRSLSWLWMFYLLQDSPRMPDFRAKLLRGLALHGRHIERYLSTYFSPNTHLLGEGVALFFLGVLCPELTAAARWKALGWKIILQEAERQVRPDGFHFEQSTYYHVYALDFFLHSAVLASINGISIPKSFEDTLEKMLTVLCLLGRGGQPPRFGDDDGGRVFDPQRNRGEHLLDPLATGAILFHRGDYKVAAGNLREETLWLLGAEGVRQWDALEESPVSTESTALAAAGLYLLPAGRSTQLVVDAGPLGTASGGHGHADALSVCLQSRGQSLLIDPGTYEYVGPGDDRNIFRGTAMHNTLRVDGLNQAEPAAPFSWSRLTEYKVERWIQRQNFDLLVSSHNGYQRLPSPVTHRRWIVSLRNGIYLVRDVIEVQGMEVRGIDGQGTHRLDLSWHLGQELQLVEDGLYRVRGASQGLALLPCAGHGWAEEVRRESWSPAYGQKAPMTVLNFSVTTALPAEFATLLVTLDEAHPGERSFARSTDPASAAEQDAAIRPVHKYVREYRYAADGMEYSFVFGESGKSWHTGSISSDAEFVCWRHKPGSASPQLNGELQGDGHLFLCNGSFAEVKEGVALRCTQPVQWAELLISQGVRNVFSSDPPAVEALSEPVLQPDPAAPVE
jgi:hypothetical protein